jgi:uncharacterized membrane protein YkvA (DUF1232 family)
MSDERNPLRPDDVIPPRGEASVQTRQLLTDAILMLPNLIKLVGRLLRDPRVPRRSKLVLGAAAAYVASPIDLIPEFIPVIGWADDVLVLMFAIDSLMDRAGTGVVEEHWDGPGDLLSMIREVVAVARNFVPARIAKTIDRLSG